MITAYDKFRNRQFDIDLPVHIFGTSSKGNSVYLSKLHTLIDLGLPYSHYTKVNPNFFLDVDYLILTHKHSDHLNPSTLIHILKDFPHVKVIMPQPMAQDILNTPKLHGKITDDIITQYSTRFIQASPLNIQIRGGIDYTFIPHYVPHGDLTNIAIEIFAPITKHHILYSSDIDTLETVRGRGNITGIPHPDTNNQFDIVFLEANYDKTLVDQALKINPNDVKALGNLRHLSEQEAWNYIEKYMADDGIFIPLHASSMYGTLLQQL